MSTDPARRLERAVVDLSTQVRRITDAMTTRTDDAPSAAVVEAQPDAAGYEFREALLVLLSRAARGVLTDDEGPLLRQHVEHLLGDRDQLAASLVRVRAVAEGGMEIPTTSSARRSSTASTSRGVSAASAPRQRTGRLS